MPEIQITIGGLDDARQRLADFPARIEKAINDALREIAEGALPLWQKATPRRTGRLRKSLYARLDGVTLTFGWTRRGFYYHPVDHGRRGGMTEALERYLFSAEVGRIIDKHVQRAI